METTSSAESYRQLICNLHIIIIYAQTSVLCNNNALWLNHRRYLDELEVCSMSIVKDRSTVVGAFCPLKALQCDNATEYLNGGTGKNKVLPIASTLLEVNVKKIHSSTPKWIVSQYIFGADTHRCGEKENLL